ncbi:MAG: hypothetical protein QXX41_01250 [Nitrososphaerota archaeon]
MGETHIEPSVRHGYRYLFLTEQLASSYKGRPSNPDELLRLVVEMERQVVTFTTIRTLLQTITRGLMQTLTIERTTTVISLLTSVSTRTVRREVTRPENVVLVAVSSVIAAAALTAYLTRSRTRRNSF